MSKVLALIAFTSVCLWSLSAQTPEASPRAKFRGFLDFGGWAGKTPNDRVTYQVKIENVGYKPATMRVSLRAGQRVDLARARLKR